MADAGDIVGEDYVIDGKTWTDSGSGVTKGEVITLGATVATATATTDGPYGVAKGTVAASGEVTVILQGAVYLVASGTVTKGQSVSAAAGGDVATSVIDMTSVSTLGAAAKRVVGVALTTATNAVVLVRLGGLAK